MYTIAVVGQKGGTTKSTLVENLAVAATRTRLSVAVVDLDPQTTAMNWRDRRTTDDVTVVSCQVSRLRFVLADCQANGVDLVFLDGPGKSAEVTIEAAKAANMVLVPTQPTIDNLETLPAVRDLLRVAGDKISMVIVNNAPIQGSRHIQAKESIENMGFTMCPVVVFHRAAFHDAPLSGLGVQEYEPDGKAAQEITQLYKYISEIVHNLTIEHDEKTTIARRA